MAGTNKDRSPLLKATSLTRRDAKKLYSGLDKIIKVSIFGARHLFIIGYCGFVFKVTYRANSSYNNIGTLFFRIINGQSLKNIYRYILNALNTFFTKFNLCSAENR